MALILALDQGTTSSRAIVFDEHADAVALAQREFGQSFPRPGWVEHDPIEIWDSQLAVAREAIAQAGADPADVAAIGITNQRETTIVWERATGRPVYPAIVWQDRRTAEFCAELDHAGHADLVRRTTGLVIDPYFSGTKVRWILDEVDGAREAAARGELAFGTVDSWLIWNLTGGRHLTDITNASRTMLFDIHAGRWSEQMLELLDIPEGLMPEVVPSSGEMATSRVEALGAELPITGVAGDQHAALFGQQCLQPGMVKTTYGTGAFLLMYLGDTPVTSKHGLLTTVAWDLGDGPRYALEGSVFIAGAAVQWLRDGLGLIDSSADIEALASSVPDSDGVYIVPAFAGLGAPHWDPFARGTIVGMSRGTTAAHLGRATLESIAFQVADVVDAMRSDSGLDLQQMRVDGGAAANELLLQMQADMVGADVVRPRQIETTALGAAFLAGLGAGVWPGLDQIAGSWHADTRVFPKTGAEDVHARRCGWNRAVERSRGWADPAGGYLDPK